MIETQTFEVTLTIETLFSRTVFFFLGEIAEKNTLVQTA